VEVDLTGEQTLGCTATDFRNRGRLHPFNTEVVMELDREKFIQLLLASAARFS
jgi:inosine-uridine nucleoside N-ribohydrolase